MHKGFGGFDFKGSKTSLTQGLILNVSKGNLMNGAPREIEPIQCGGLGLPIEHTAFFFGPEPF